MKTKLITALNNVLENLRFPTMTIIIQLPKNPSHGDFSTNIAMQLSNKVNKNALDIAKNISDNLKTNYPNLIESINIAGPGFINIHVKKDQIISQLQMILKKNDDFGKTNHGKGKKALIEFVSANPTGPLTVGHGRGAILGDVISNVLKWNGYAVEREYYYNDAGRQMERLGLSVQARYLELQGRSINFPKEGYEGEYIIDIARELFEEKGDSLTNQTELSPFTKAAEKRIFKLIKHTLSQMGLIFDRYFNEQSLYDSGAIKHVLQKLKEKGLIYEHEGATWFKATNAGRDQDKVIIKSSGEPTYRLPDIAYHRDKLERGYDLIIDVLGADHMDAYPDVIAAIESMDYSSEKIKILIHQFVTLIKNGEPVKMSTRKAQYVTLDELIEEVGADVVRYFFLMRGMNSHLNFDINLARDESDDNPVFYLQYAHARLCNILKHAKSLEYDIQINSNLSYLNMDSEINLIKYLMEFPLILKNTFDNLEPQNIANYLQNLAGQFHRYYANTRIITSDHNVTAARLVLVNAIKIVLHNGLTILGINAPERM